MFHVMRVGMVENPESIGQACSLEIQKVDVAALS